MSNTRFKEILEHGYTKNTSGREIYTLCAIEDSELIELCNICDDWSDISDVRYGEECRTIADELFRRANILDDSFVPSDDFEASIDRAIDILRSKDVMSNTETSTNTAGTKFTAFEDSGGGIALFIIDDNGNAIAGFGNFEYQRGSLKEAIADINDYRSFGGDFGGDTNMPMHLATDDDGFDIPDRELTIDELYRCWADDETNTMIAWSDGKSVSYCEVERMGYAARLALDIKEDA